MFAVHPDAQGKGVGSALLKCICNLADRKGDIAYLECTSAKNESFYGNKGGFNVVGDRIKIENSKKFPGDVFEHGLAGMVRPSNAPGSDDGL